MKTPLLALAASLVMPFIAIHAAEAAEPQKALPLPGEVFEVAGRTAFVILPAAENLHPNRPTPWVWYAPTLPALPEARENWMFERFLAAGIAVAGVDVGESYGSPQGRAHFTALYQELTGKRGFSRKPVLLPRSRGGLMLYNWAAEHPDSVGGIAGIYPVCNIRSWPGLNKACGAYGLSAEQLDEQLAQHNPIDRLAPLAKAGVPIFHIHGDTDDVVPLHDNSGLLASRYRELGGSMRLRIPPGQGHNVWDGFFQCRELVEFVIAHASPAASREPSAALFRDPPMEARPGAFWDWMNGNVDLDRMTYELKEMKAKGMSGVEIWDIGVIRPIPEEPIPAGPAFLGPESLKAVNHAIEQADRLGLHLGIVASSSWNAGGSWVEPRDAMKGFYHSEITVNGPAKLSQALPFPKCSAPKGANGLPLYYKEIAVLAFPQTTNKVIRDTASVVNLSEKMNSEGLLTWDVPAGSWVIARFITSNTGQKLTVPTPNSNGLLIDHLDGNAARRHFRYIIDQILKVRPSLDALRYMEVDSVEVGNQTDWTDSFVAEFRQRRGYDPVPYLPVLKGKSFADPQVTSRFQHDYHKTVSDLWIDGHYAASREFLNTYGMQLVAEGGHGGYPRAEPLRACGVVDIIRGEFWNGSQFWVVKEAASAAHIYGRQIVDAESFTGWRSWQDGPLEYKRLADTAFCDGLNRITFHTFAHTPPSGGVPGNMYHAGEHFNVNATWWPKAAPMLFYFSRCCYLLQQGQPVADVCFYYGDDAPNLVATRRIGPDSKRLDGATCAHCGRPNPAPADALGTGYDYDVINSDVIENRMEFKDGRLTLPHGVSYEVIVLPERTDIPLSVLTKLETLVREGATLLGPKPERDTSLADYPRCDEQVKTIAARIWGPGNDAEAAGRSYGKGRVIADRKRVREILQQRGIGPDFAYSSPGKPADLDYIHRRTQDADIYFVTNTKMEDAEADCTFRVTQRLPQFWHADTGKIEPCTDYKRVPGGMKLKLRLPPAGSMFVVFSGAAPETDPTPEPKADSKPTAPLDIVGPWEVRFPPNLGAPPSRVFDELVSWTTIPDDGIKYFSGTATYLKEFEVPASFLIADGRMELSLGQIRNVADVTLNGKPLGILWKPPYVCDVTGMIRSGKNELKVEITNLWANRLVGDAKLPREKRVTRITQQVPIQGPHESGLLGPVQLLLTLAHSTSFAGEKWLDEFNVGDIASGYSDSRPNKSISDKPLSVGGVVFKRGAGTHAPSSGSFKTDGRSPLRFTAKVGADDSVDGVGSVVFQVFGDDKKFFDSGLMRKGDPAKDVDVDLTGHKQIELRVTDGENGNTFDHANWCDARFVYADSPPQLALRWTLDLPHFSGEAPAAPSKFTAVTSPNGKVAAHVGVSGGRLVLAVRLDGKTVLEPSPLGVMVDGVDLGENVEPGTLETYTTNTTYPDPRGPGSLQDQCKGVKLSLRSKGSASAWILDIRAYDDGVAWRYLVPGSGTRKVTAEATSFVLPEGATYWSHHNTINYEGNFLSFTAKGSSAIKPVTMPITVELPAGGFACITEANIIGYSGMTIGPRGRILTGIFEDDTKGWNLAGNITTPWRIVIAVDSLDALVNQSIVYNVSPPPDPKLFPKGKDTDWIKPGCAYWTWNIGQRDSANWDRIQGFVDDAASLNCPYYVIDDGWRYEQCGWHRNGKDEWVSLKEFCAYAARKNVKLMVWQHSGGIRDLAAREEFFRNVSEAGAVGVKIDFMDDESQQTLEFFRSCLEIGARHKVMINFHGANKPAGEERTWPHWMTREAILGMENGGGIQRQTFAALPFTRLVTGPADFTPADFRPGPMGNSTAGSQLAIAVAYASPLLHWSDSVNAYKAQGPEVLDFIRNKPAVWDETRILPGSKIGKAALMARRSGEVWYVATINGTDQDMTPEITTSFLAAGKWDAVSFSDVPGDKTKLSVNKSSVTRASVVNARMSPGGGFVMVIRHSLPAGAEEGELPAREGTLHVLSFGVGAPMDGPPVDDLYGRDAGFVAEALNRSPSAWTRVETTFVSGLACTPERLRTELERLGKAASASDLVLIHASTHGTTEDGFLRLDGAKGPPVINANALAASLAGLPCPSLVTIDACMAGGAVRSPLPPRSAWLLGCSETQSTGGQYDDPKVPHGFLVLALCEALRGDADSDRDGVVTVGELCAWVPKRATYLARFSCSQDGVVVLPADLAALPLTRAVPGEHKPLWSMPRVESRNPWGLPDPSALPQDAKPAASAWRSALWPRADGTRAAAISSPPTTASTTACPTKISWPT